MAKINERETTLLGLFMPPKWRFMRPIVVQWNRFMTGPSKGTKPEELVWLEFDFNKIYKAVIYRDLVQAVVEKWLQVSMKDLARYMAMYSNLADNEDLRIRTETIYRELKNYKNKMLKHYGTVNITKCQRQ